MYESVREERDIAYYNSIVSVISLEKIKKTYSLPCEIG